MKKQEQAKKVCMVGGQAVMEGVMMKAPKGIAMAVRQAGGDIVTEYTEYTSKVQKGTIWAWPVLRGVVTFVESLTLGMRTITRSAELFGEDFAEEPTKFEKWLSEKTGKSIDKIIIGFAVVIAVALAVGLFFMLPTFLSALLLKNVEAASGWKTLVEGLVRLAIFFCYIVGIGFMKDAKRLFMYHGAEHKVISCYEHEAPLTPESARQYTRFHARCGTNYLFLVMAVSILFFAMIGYNSNFWLRLGTRLIFLPVVAGLSYEVLRLGAKSDSLLARIVRAPGLALQRLTTKEPDDAMLEVAITAFQMAMQAMENEQPAQAAEQSGSEEAGAVAGETKAGAEEHAGKAEAQERDGIPAAAGHNKVKTVAEQAE